MNDPDNHPMRELSWRRKRTPVEEAELQAWLAAHPEAKMEWEAETGLSRLLEQLPEAPPVASNFTALVLQAVERDAAAVRTRRLVGRSWLGWLPRAAVAAAVLCLGIFSYHLHETNHRAAMAQSIAEVSRVAVVSNPEVMENFEAIRRLGDPQPTPDTELLALLK